MDHYGNHYYQKEEDGDNDDDEEGAEDNEDERHTKKRKRSGNNHSKNDNSNATTSTNKNSNSSKNDEMNEGLTVHSYGAVNVEHIEDECWLIRIPPSVAELWEKTKEGTYLGDLSFTKGSTNTGPAPMKPSNSIMPSSRKPTAPTTATSVTATATSTAKPSMSIHLDEEMVRKQLERHAKKKNPKSTQLTSLDTGNSVSPAIKMIPLHYSLQSMTKKVPVLHPMIRNPKSGRVILNGTITRTANLQVERNDSRYRSMIKDRLVSSMAVSKFVKPMEATDGIINKHARTKSSANGGGIPGTSNKKNSFAEAVFQFGNRRKLDALEGNSNTVEMSDSNDPNKKSVKTLKFSPDQPLRSVLFELFQQQKYWTIKDLRSAALSGGAFASQASINQKRLEGEIREVLREEIGEYHRSGDFKNKWELRKEFQQYSSSTGNNNGPSMGGTPKSVSKSSSSNSPGSANNHGSNSNGGSNS
jgi:TFIIF, beta subunit HTH domain